MKVDDIIADHFPDNAAPGCAALLWQKGEATFATRGLANVETGAAITEATTFRLASVSKQFTAACILQLAEKNLLRLDQPLTDFFPQFAAYGRSIEVEHLLRHTSGLKDYEQLLPENQVEQVRDTDVLNLMAAQDTGDFAPGEKFRYSNTGYAVLAMIVEAVSGMEFPEYLRRHIFEPAGMTAVAFVDRPDAPQPPNRAIGYALGEDGQFRWADQNVTTAVLGDGGIYCSVADYAQWIGRYFAGKVISPEMVERAWQPTLTMSGEVVPYGYGWRLEISDTIRPYHPGSTSGFRNGTVVDVENCAAVLVLTNRCNGDAVALAREILESGSR